MNNINRFHKIAMVLCIICIPLGAAGNNPEMSTYTVTSYPLVDDTALRQVLPEMRVPVPNDPSSPIGPTIPEPSTYAMLALGLVGIGMAVWRRRRLLQNHQRH